MPGALGCGGVAGLAWGWVAVAGLVSSAGGSAGAASVSGLAASAGAGGAGGSGGVSDMAYEFDVEDEVGFGRDAGRAAEFAVGELVGDEEAALAADVHALKSGVPADDDAVGAVGEGDGFAAGVVVGGVELGAVGRSSRCSGRCTTCAASASGPVPTMVSMYFRV